MLVYVVYFLLSIIMFASLIVWIAIITKLLQQKSPCEFEPREPIRWHVVVALAIVSFAGWRAYQAQTTTNEPVATVDFESMFDNIRFAVLLNFVIVAVIPAYLAVVFRRKLSDFGFRVENWQRQFSTGVIAFLAAALPVAAIQLSTVLSGIRQESDIHPFLAVLRDNPQFSVVAWVGISAVVFAPAAEELLYRVVVQGCLQSRLNPYVAIVLSSLAFSCVHSWPDPLPLFPLALILGYVYYRSNSYLTIVTAHALFNAVNLVLALSTVGGTPS